MCRNSTVLCVSEADSVRWEPACVDMLSRCKVIFSQTVLQVAKPLVRDGMEKEEHLLAHSPPTMKEVCIHLVAIGCCMTMFGGVYRESTGVGEGRELGENCHV